MPVELAAENLRRMVQSGKELGIPVALIDVLPWNNGHPSADAPIEQLNDLIDEIGRDEDVPVLPFHDTLESPTQPGVMAGALTDRRRSPFGRGVQAAGRKGAGRLELALAADRAPDLPFRWHATRGDRTRSGGSPRSYLLRSSAGGSPHSPICICGGQVPNQLSRAPSRVSTAPLKKSPAGEAR